MAAHHSSLSLTEISGGSGQQWGWEVQKRNNSLSHLRPGEQNVFKNKLNYYKGGLCVCVWGGGRIYREGGGLFPPPPVDPSTPTQKIITNV